MMKGLMPQAPALVGTYGVSKVSLSTAPGLHSKGRQRCRVVTSVRTTGQQASQPSWTGDGVLSRLANWVIATPPLYAGLKAMARRSMQKSADQRGVGWQQHVQRLRDNPEVYQIKEEMEDKSLQYPQYYLQPFHAYEDGNLSWLAAFEVEPATYAIALKTFVKDATLSPDAALSKLRGSANQALQGYCQQFNTRPFQTILDAGCSTGISTRSLADTFPSASVTGLDLSPYMLSVAELRERQAFHSSESPAERRRITYKHGLAEASGFPDKSQDLVAFNFVIHECPQHIITEFMAEAKRMLRPGGVLLMLDNNPLSKTIQNLPAPIFTMMKSTEPYTDQYYSYDVEGNMRAAGLLNVATVESDHRHRVVMGMAPSS